MKDIINSKIKKRESFRPFAPSVLEEEVSRFFECDGGGAGRQRGAPGVFLEFGPDGCDIEIGYVSDGTINAASGACGGGKGAHARQFIRRINGKLNKIESCAQITIRPGENIVCYTAGGGGYGIPLERDIKHVVHDIKERWVSKKAAQEIYGVVLNNNGMPDVHATNNKRSELGS